jgi:hypothetical protein
MPESELWQPCREGVATKLPSGGWLVIRLSLINCPDVSLLWTTSVSDDALARFTRGLGLFPTEKDAKEAAEAWIAEQWPLYAITRANRS